MATFPVAAGARITTAVINHAYSISDVSVTTVTAASYTDLSTVYTVPANDAALGVSYELMAHGYGTWGSTAQTLQMGLFFGAAIVGVAPTLGNSVFAISTPFRWKVTLELTPNGSSSTAGWMGSLAGVITESNANVLPTTGANNSVAYAGGNSAAVTVDATAAQVFSLRCQWASTSGAPTITCVKTRYTRLG
jgi:hypothetical protein